MPLATHQTLEEIEAREAANISRRNLALIVNRDNLTWELRMNSRSFFAGKLVGLGELSLSAVDLGESTVNICRGNLRRNSNPSVVLDGINHGLTAGMTETLVQPENFTKFLRSDTGDSLPVKTGRIRSNVCDNTFEPLRILEVDRGVQQVTNIDVEHLVGMHDRKFLHG